MLRELESLNRLAKIGHRKKASRWGVAIVNARDGGVSALRQEESDASSLLSHRVPLRFGGSGRVVCRESA